VEMTIGMGIIAATSRSLAGKGHRRPNMFPADAIY